MIDRNAVVEIQIRLENVEALESPQCRRRSMLKTKTDSLQLIPTMRAN